MSGTINTRIQLKRDSTANWNAALGFVPLQGELIIYNDYKTIQKEVDGELTTVYVPGVKIGDGSAYVQDLPFVDAELRDKIMTHIDNPNIHSKVRIPRSHRIIRLLPPAIMYSALIRSSWIVLESPLFRRTGLSVLPSSFKSS